MNCLVTNLLLLLFLLGFLIILQKNLFRLLRESTTHISKGFKAHQEQSSALMEKFLNSQDCRRKFVMDHFEDNISDYNKTKKNCCDNCTRA